MKGKQNDLACTVGLLLKACPFLKKCVPHAEWLEYLHTARYTAGKLRGKERDVAARAAGCGTIEGAVRMAECLSDRETAHKCALWWE